MRAAQEEAAFLAKAVEVAQAKSELSESYTFVPLATQRTQAEAERREAVSLPLYHSYHSLCFCIPLCVSPFSFLCQFPFLSVSLSLHLSIILISLSFYRKKYQQSADWRLRQQ